MGPCGTLRPHTVSLTNRMGLIPFGTQSRFRIEGGPVAIYARSNEIAVQQNLLCKTCTIQLKPKTLYTMFFF